MSVLHLLGTAREGGAETYFVDLVTALRRAGVAEAAAIRAHSGREAALRGEGVAVEAFGFGGPLDLLTRPQAAGFAKRQGVKLALAWMSRAARHTPKGPWARIARLGGYYNLKYYKGFDVLVANTEDIADWIVGQGWPAGRVRYIPNFAAAPEAVAPIARASLDTPADAPLLLAMGRLHEAKAHDVSLAALARLPGAYLWIAGVGPEEAKLRALAQAHGVASRVRFLGWRTDPSALYRTADVCLFPSRYEPLGNVVIQAWAHGLPVVAAESQGPKALVRPEEDKLRALAQAHGVASRVRFLGWRTDPSALYRTADLCLFPSRYEPLGNVVIQAWAHGLPVVAAESQGPKALVRPEEDALLVPIDDADALAQSARRLIEEPPLRAKLAARGLARVEAEFSKDAVVGQWTDLFADYGAV